MSMRRLGTLRWKQPIFALSRGHRRVTLKAAPDTQRTLENAIYLDKELQGDPARQVQLHASKAGRKFVAESGKPLGDYMALPASQYSVLDGNKVERLDDETFRVYVGALKFFTFEIEPVLTLRVHPVEDGCDISMLACKLRGSGLVEAQNSKFASRMTNKVRLEGVDDARYITSDITVEVDLIVPGWFVLPKSTIRATGTAVMSAVLNTAVPKFLQQLENDYRAWAEGDDSRQPIGTGEFL